MATKREYLASQGITVGKRGRFSGAAKVALQEAAAKGIQFTAEKPVKSAK
jgi:histone H3/H4